MKLSFNEIRENREIKELKEKKQKEKKEKRYDELTQDERYHLIYLKIKGLR